MSLDSSPTKEYPRDYAYIVCRLCDRNISGEAYATVKRKQWTFTICGDCAKAIAKAIGKKNATRLRP